MFGLVNAVKLVMEIMRMRSMKEKEPERKVENRRK